MGVSANRNGNGQAMGQPGGRHTLLNLMNNAWGGPHVRPPAPVMNQVSTAQPMMGQHVEQPPQMPNMHPASFDGGQWGAMLAQAMPGVPPHPQGISPEDWHARMNGFRGPGRLLNGR